MTEFHACFLQEWWPFPCSETTLQVFAVFLILLLGHLLENVCVALFLFFIYLFVLICVFQIPDQHRWCPERCCLWDPQNTVNWFPGCHWASATRLPPRRPVPCSWRCWASPKTAAFKTDQAGGRASLRWSWLFNVQANQCHSPLPLFSQHPQEEQDPHRLVLDSLSRGPSCISCQSSC